MASILDRLAEKAGRGAVGLLLLSELRKLRRTLEIGIDSQREIAAFDPIFSKRGGDVATVAEELATESDNPDWLRLDLLEQLARQQHVPIDDTTDLVALGIERGWLTPEGELASLPDGTDSTY